MMKWMRLCPFWGLLFVSACHGTRPSPNDEVTSSPSEQGETPQVVVVTPTITPEVETPSASPTPDSEIWQEGECPPEWVLIPAASADLGASPELMAEVNEEGYLTSRIPMYEVLIEEDFCMSPFPFPGEAGSEWPEGINLTQAGELDSQLAEFGMRLASGSEQLMATASTANHRWPQGVGSWAEAKCDEDPNNPHLMGDYPTCQSALGVGALLTFAFWVRADEPLKAALGWGNPAAYMLVGGMPTSWNAYYGDDVWGVHQHGEEDPYADDKPGFIVCTPGEVTWEQWTAFQEYAI